MKERRNEKDIGNKIKKNRKKKLISFFDTCIVERNAAIFSEKLNRIAQMTPPYFHVEVKFLQRFIITIKVIEANA